MHFKTRTNTRAWTLLLVLAVFALSIGSVRAGSITISGTVVDPNGFPMPGVTITLAGSADNVELTNGSGSYSFSGLADGSYSVRPTPSASCGFTPDVVNLNNLKTSVTQNFTGSADCFNNGVSLALGPVGSSVFTNGTVSINFSILNTGAGPASQVNVTAVTLGNGALVSPPLPVSLGEMNFGTNVPFDAQFAGLQVPGTYQLTVTGNFVVSGTSQSFTLQTSVTVTQATNNTANAQNATVNKQVAPGNLPPVTVTPDGSDNPAGPGIPVGQTANVVPVPQTTSGAQVAGSASSVTFVRDTVKANTGTLVPPDPAAAEGGGVVLSTANSYVRFSSDDGVTFTQFNPTSIFPQSDGGLCCDQVVIYAPSVNLYFWLLQYKPGTSTVSGQPGPNRLRIAFATPSAMTANFSTAWSYVDLTSSLYNIGNFALDFPDLAITGTNLYVSVDIQKTATNVNGFIVTRMALADLANTSLSTIGLQFVSPTQMSDQTIPTGSRLAQSTTNAMYWAGHVDTSHMKVFHWADGSNSIDDHQVQVNTWCRTNYTSLAPDGVQWLDSSRTSGSGSVIGATLVPPPENGHATLWFAWGAAADTSSCNQGGRPNPYVKIAEIDATTFSEVGEYHVWNGSYAFAYPSLATDFNGNVGMAVSFGGTNNFASTTVGFAGDFVVFYNEASDVTETFTQTNSSGATIVNSSGQPVLFTRFGDFFVVRQSGSSESPLFAGEGYAVELNNSTLSKNCTTSPGCNSNIHYIQWGRPSGGTIPR